MTVFAARAINRAIEGAGGKGGGRAPVEAADSLRSSQTAEVLDLWSEGEIQGLTNGLKGVYLDGVPIENPDGSRNFEGVDFAYVNGTQGQAALPGFDTVQNEVAVGVSVVKDTPVVRTITDATFDQVRVTIAVPQLTHQHPNTGDLNGSKFEYAIDVQSDGGGYVERVRETIEGKTTSVYKRAKKIRLTGSAPWDIRVRRITDDSDTATTTNAFGWESYTEISSLRLRYPNSAIGALRVSARQFSRIPTRAYDLLGLRVEVPSNYDPITRTYTGTWDGTFKIAWTDCPPWIFRALATNKRWGLGSHISAAAVNKWQLYRIAQYCDAMVSNGRGGLEPRFTCNLYLQTREQGRKVLQDLAAVFRAMAFFAGGELQVVQDAPSDPVMLFTPANVVDGRFTYQDQSELQRHSVFIVHYNDLAQMGKRVPEVYAPDELVARYGISELELSPIGVWSRSQAQRLARWAAYSEEMEGDVVSFAVGAEGELVLPGKVFQIADPNEAGERMGGRVASATASEVTLDADVTMGGGETYTLTVQFPDPADDAAYITEQRAVTTPHSTTRVLAVAPPFSAAPAAHSTWLLQSEALAPTTWRCLGVREVAGADQYEITAVAHHPGKFALIEQGIVLQERPISRLTLTPPKPASIEIIETPYLVGTSYRSRATVSWPEPALGLTYIVTWRHDSGPWTELPAAGGNTADIANLPRGTLQVQVQSRNALGRTSAALSASQVLLGKTAKPSNVAALNMAIEPFGMRVSWPLVADADVELYELRVDGTDWDSATVLERVKGSSFLWRVQAAGERTLRIKALDTSGNYSAAEFTVTIDLVAVAAPVVTYGLQQSDELISWTIPTSWFAIDYYLLRYGASWDSATPLDSTKATSYRRRADFGGARRYWVAAVDVAGNVGAPAAVDVSITPPGEVTGTRAEVVDNNALLYWSPPASGSLPVDRYEVRKGASFAAGSVVGSNGNSTFTTVFEQSAGIYSYWVAAVDSAGNVGPALAIVATINQPPDYILRTSIDSAFTGTLANLYAEAGALLGPINTAETWAEHFTTNGWSTPQDQVDAGYPLYAMPSLTSGSYSETFDYFDGLPETTERVLPATIVTATLGWELVAGAVTVVCQIAYKAAAADPWINAGAGETSVLATNFRYVRVTWTLTCTAGANLARIHSFNLRLAQKMKTDSGVYEITDAAAGVWVPFNVAFIDADLPICQAAGATPVFEVIDFLDAPFPDGFTVYHYNTSGVKVMGSGAFTVRGY